MAKEQDEAAAALAAAEADEPTVDENGDPVDTDEGLGLADVARQNAEAADDKAEDDAKPKADKDADDRRQWDRDRQQRDQERANERRALQDQLRAANELNERLAAAVEKINAGPQPEAKKAQDDLAEIRQQVEELSDASGAAELAGGVKAVLKALEQFQAKHPDEDPKLLKRLDDLQARLEKSEQDTQSREQERETQIAQAARNSSFNRLVAGLAKTHGDEHRNEALARVEAYYKQQGFGDDNQPDQATEELAIRHFYAEVAREAAGKKKPKPGIPRVDRGRPGAVPNAGKKLTGSMDDMARQMAAEGKLG